MYRPDLGAIPHKLAQHADRSGKCLPEVIEASQAKILQAAEPLLRCLYYKHSFSSSFLDPDLVRGDFIIHVVIFGDGSY